MIVSRLLEYPDAALWQHQQGCLRQLLRRKICRKKMPMRWHFPARFNDDGFARCPGAVQRLFDRGRATSLLLFEHVHGESAIAVRRWWTCWHSTSSTVCVKQPRIARPFAAVSGVSGAAPQSEAVEGLKDIAPILALLTRVCNSVIAVMPCCLICC